MICILWKKKLGWMRGVEKLWVFIRKMIKTNGKFIELSSRRTKRENLIYQKIRWEKFFLEINLNYSMFSQLWCPWHGHRFYDFWFPEILRFSDFLTKTFSVTLSLTLSLHESIPCFSIKQLPLSVKVKNKIQ